MLQPKKVRPIFDSRLLSILCALCTGILIAAAFLGATSVMKAQANGIGIGLVTDGDTVFDGSFNWLSYQGLMRAETDLGVVGSVYTSTSPADYYPNLTQCVSDTNQLCFSVGFLTTEAIQAAAETYTDTLFSIVDIEFESYPDNLRGITFASDEVGYLAGTLAGLMTESDIIGDLGGMEIPPVTLFTLAYLQGAACANPDVTTILSYTWNFGDPAMGAEYAQAMIAQGADVIFAAAGGTGNGAILTATQSGVWGIGVDADQYISLFNSGSVDGADKLLSSAMKRIDNAVFGTIQDVISGTFTSGTMRYGLAQDGVGLAPFHETEPFIADSVKAYLGWVRRGIAEGWLTTDGPCLSTKIFVPLASRQ